MTNGASQGLFVIVAVVIFGIFVLISYMLFRDKLKTGLADIFDDSISQATDDLTIWTNLPNLNLINTVILNKTNTEYSLKLNPNANVFYWGDESPIGVRIPNVEVKAGETIKVSFEITSSKDAQFIIDFNMSPIGETNNDYYSKQSITNVTMLDKSKGITQLESNKTKKITYTLTNSTGNTLYESTSIGIIKRDASDNIFKISNTKYTIINK